MKILVCDADAATREIFDTALSGHELLYVEGPVSDELIAAHTDIEVISFFIASTLRRERIEKLPLLKCIVPRSTGYDHVDVTYAAEKGIPVCTVPRYGAHTVAEFTFALMLSLSRRIVDSVNCVREKGCFVREGLEGFELFGKTLGVIGTGAIGRNTVTIASGFGMRVYMFDMYPNQSLVSDTAQYVPLDLLLQQSDIVTLHTPYTPETHHLINETTLAQMKKGSYLINTARGELVDTPALVAALQSGHLAGAGLDVIEGERALGTHDASALMKADAFLLTHPNVIITPHSAFYSHEAYREILSVSADNIRAFSAGTPQNMVAI